MKRQLLTTCLLVIFAFTISACSARSATSPAKATPTTLAIQTDLPIQEASSTPAGSSIPFPNLAGLDQLDSYALSLRVSFKGIQDGQTVDMIDLYTRTYSLDPAMLFTTIQTTDDNGKPTTFLRGWIDDVLYMRAGLAEPCTARVVSSADHQTFNPAVLLRPIMQGKEMERETMNGVPARHYVMDTLQNANTQISGEVWIADPGAFVVKYVMFLKGGEEYFGKGNQGEQMIEYEVRDAGAKKPVAIPVDCPPPVTDLPAMPDATDLTRSLTQLSYTTASGIAETAAFYQEQMKALGWDLESSSAPSASAQEPTGMGAIPNMPALPVVPGMDLGQYLPTTNPATGAPTMQDGWMIFIQTKEQIRAYILLRPEGANLQVQVRIVQD
jgi:hypothetical protein